MVGPGDQPTLRTSSPIWSTRCSHHLSSRTLGYLRCTLKPVIGGKTCYFSRIHRPDRLVDCFHGITVLTTVAARLNNDGAKEEESANEAMNSTVKRHAMLKRTSTITSDPRRLAIQAALNVLDGLEDGWRRLQMSSPLLSRPMILRGQPINYKELWTMPSSTVATIFYETLGIPKPREQHHPAQSSAMRQALLDVPTTREIWQGQIEHAKETLE
jgi:hypothetical protein